MVIASVQKITQQAFKGHQSLSLLLEKSNSEESEIRVHFHLAVKKHCTGKATCLLNSASNVQLLDGFQSNEAL